MEHLAEENAGRFRRVNRALMRSIEKKVSITQVYRAQHQVLMGIAREPYASQTEIAERMEISPAALAVSLKKLEKGGYIRRNSDATDERKKRLEMTELGERVVSESKKMFQEVEKQMFQGFSQAEMEQLADYMDRMLENLLCVQDD